MELLKYLDVLIGLTVVMILLSPAVTAITQVFMFAFNRRSRFLHKGLVNLIRQLDPAPAEQWSVPALSRRPGRGIEARRRFGDGESRQ
jgi:hypothetical protein